MIENYLKTQEESIIRKQERETRRMENKAKKRRYNIAMFCATFLAIAMPFVGFVKWWLA